jgi:exoribonuclease-2
MNVLFEEDGAFRAGSVLADNVTSLQIELASASAARSRPPTSCCVSPHRHPANCWSGRRRKRKASTSISSGKSAANRSSASRISPPSTTAPNRIPCRRQRCCCACIRHRSTSTARAAAASARRRRKSCRPRWPAWKRSASRRRPSSAWSTNSSTANAARRVPAHPAATDLQARSQPPRDQGARSRLRGNRKIRGAPAVRLRRAAVDPRLPPRPLPLRVLPREQGRHGLSGDFAGAPANPPICRWPLSPPSASTMRIRPRSTTPSRSRPKPDGGWQIGIHIAAPGLGFGPDSDLGRIARERLSTVYMPGRKITMLPEDVVEHFTLAAGHTVPQSRSTSMSLPTTACSATKRAWNACPSSPTCATTTSSRCSTPIPWPPACRDFPTATS